MSRAARPAAKNHLLAALPHHDRGLVGDEGMLGISLMLGEHAVSLVRLGAGRRHRLTDGGGDLSPGTQT